MHLLLRITRAGPWSALFFYLNIVSVVSKLGPCFAPGEMVTNLLGAPIHFRFITAENVNWISEQS